MNLAITYTHRKLANYTLAAGNASVPWGVLFWCLSVKNCFAWELPKKNFTSKQTERQYKADIRYCDSTHIKLQWSSSKHFTSMAASWLIRLIFLAVNVLSANLLVISNSDFCASVFETKNGNLTRSALFYSFRQLFLYLSAQTKNTRHLKHFKSPSSSWLFLVLKFNTYITCTTSITFFYFWRFPLARI